MSSPVQPSSLNRLPQALLLVALLGRLSAVAAQGVPDTSSTAVLLEDVFEMLGDGQGAQSALSEDLEALPATPLDVNTADGTALAMVPAIGPALAQAIVAERTKNGPFDALEALQRVDGIDAETLDAARPFLVAAAAAPAPRWAAMPSLRSLARSLRLEITHRVGRRLDLGSGYDSRSEGTTYAGSPDRLYTRLRAYAGRRLSLNLTLEKDPGEAFRWHPASQTYGFDHLTAHAALRDYGRIASLVVGDFTAAYGQGLVLWRSSAFGKGRDPVRPLVRSGPGILPYGSTEENRFLRGLATTIRLTPALAVSAFVSRRRLDARILAPDTTQAVTIKDPAEAVGLTGSGLHRTPTERAQKDAVREDLAGGHVGFARGLLDLGVVGYTSRFDRSFRTGAAPYERFDFRGKTASAAGVYASVSMAGAYLFGEAARSGEAVGGLAGIMVRTSEVAEALVLVRHYPRAFVSLHGFGFGERNGATRNETGFYTGVVLRPAPAWRLAAYADHYRSPWARFDAPRPSSGHDLLLLLEHRPRSWLRAYVQGRSETREAAFAATDPEGRLLDALRHETRQSVRLHADYDFSQRLRLRARIEGVRFKAAGMPHRYGLLLYQDVRWRAIRRLRFDARLAFFDTDGFDARVFVYENDVRYTFSVPSFSGLGQRLYVLATCTPTKHLTIEAKAAITRFENVQSVGSGLDEVPGKRIREVRAQLRWRF